MAFSTTIYLFAPNARTERRTDELHRMDGCPILHIQNWVHLYHVHADQFAGLGYHFTGKMRLTERQTTVDRSSHTWSVTWVECIHIKREVNSIGVAAGPF